MRVGNMQLGEQCVETLCPVITLPLGIARARTAVGPDEDLDDAGAEKQQRCGQ